MRAVPALLTLLIAGMLLSTGGCPPASTDVDPNATTVAGAIEQFLPTAVTLDIDELPEDPDAENGQTGAPLRNMYERVVRSSATIVHRFHRLADRALALGATVRDDMLDPNQTQVAGTFTVAGQQVSYKADFAAFDFDTDGTPDGSGNALDLPVALRIWADRGDGYQRFLCALITQKPATENLGSGQFYVRPIVALATAPDGVQVYVDYDRSSPAHRWNRAFVTGRIHPRYGLTIGLGRVDVRTDAGGDVEKTVRSAHEHTDNPYGFTTFQSAAHWLYGGTGLLVSATATGGETEVGFSNVCVSLTERALAAGGECDDFDTQDMELLDVPTGDETAFPTAFPEQPTF